MKNLSRALFWIMWSWGAVAGAQSAFPAKPVTFLVQQSPGSTGDLVARALGEALSKRWGQGVVVENKPGANGMIATSQVARAKPDGYTLLVSGSTPLAFNPHLYASVPYDLRTDFSFIAPIMEAQFVLLASHRSGFKTYAEFVGKAKQNPGKYTYGSGGLGNSTHLVMDMIATASKLELVHIPFNGVGPAMLSTVAGEIDLMTSVFSSALSQITAGKVVPLAVSGAARAPQLPDVPTFDEVGVKGPPSPGWLVLIGPKGMSAQLVTEINGHVRAVLQDEALIAKLRGYHGRPIVGAPSVGADRFMREYREWGDYIKQRGIKAE